MAYDTVCLLDIAVLEEHAAFVYNLHFASDIRPYLMFVDPCIIV